MLGMVGSCRLLHNHRMDMGVNESYSKSPATGIASGNIGHHILLALARYEKSVARSATQVRPKADYASSPQKLIRGRSQIVSSDPCALPPDNSHPRVEQRTSAAVQSV